MYDKILNTAQELLNKVEELIKEGNLRRIIIKDQDGDIFIEIPVIFGAIVVIAAPVVSAIGIIAGYASHFTVEIIKKDNSKILMLCENNSSDELN